MRTIAIVLVSVLGCGESGESDTERATRWKREAAEQTERSREYNAKAAIDAPPSADTWGATRDDSQKQRTPADAEQPIDLDDASPHEEAQRAIGDEVGRYLDATFGRDESVASVTEEDFAIVVWRQKCDRTLLERIRGHVASKRMDLAKAFVTIQCVNTGPVISLR